MRKRRLNEGNNWRSQRKESEGPLVGNKRGKLETEASRAGKTGNSPSDGWEEKGGAREKSTKVKSEASGGKRLRIQKKEKAVKIA